MLPHQCLQSKYIAQVLDSCQKPYSRLFLRKLSDSYQICIQSQRVKHVMGVERVNYGRGFCGIVSPPVGAWGKVPEIFATFLDFQNMKPVRGLRREYFGAKNVRFTAVF